MKLNYAILGCITLLLCGCKVTQKVNRGGGEVVVCDSLQSGDDMFCLEFIQDMELIPLQTSDSSLIGTDPELIVSGTDYYIIDQNGSQRILRYDTNGRFLNRIGNRGKGAQEYLKISNMVVDSMSNVITIFSSTDAKICSYSNTGDFISGRKVNSQFSQGFPAKNGNLWLYLGYQNGASDYRVRQVDAQDRPNVELLTANEKVMPVEEKFPVFIPASDGRILLRESLNPTVYALTGEGTVVPRYSFDFGEYAVPEEYYEQSSPMAAVELLMKRPFTILDRILDRKNYVVIQAQVQYPNVAPMLIYGIKKKNENRWLWFNFEDIPNNQGLWVNSIQDLTDNDELICLVDPIRLLKNSDQWSIFKNPEVLSGLNEEDNPVLIKCQLK